MVFFWVIIHTISALKYQIYLDAPKLPTLLKSSEQLPLGNAYSSQYYIKLLHSPSNREFILTIGTESTWTWLVSSSCNCHNSIRYDYQDQTCNSSLNTSIQYTIGSVSGPVCTDQFTLKSYKIELPFILAEAQQHLYWVVTDGFLGLGLDKDMNNSIIQVLFNEKMIHKRLFGLYLSKDESYKHSQITFGRDEPEDYSDSEEVLVNVTGKQWKSTVNFESFGSPANSSVEVLFSPEFIGIFVPQSEWPLVESEILARMDCEPFILFFKCKGDEYLLPSLNFSYFKQNLTISPQTFTHRSEESLIVLLGVHNQSYWVLGQPLFKDYYSVFDMDKEAISFYKVAKKFDVSTFIYLIVCIFLIVVICVPLLVYCFISKKKQDLDLTQPLIN